MALVIERRDGEAITVNGPAVIRVRREGNRVKLLISGPKSTKVLREEIENRRLTDESSDA